MVGFCRHVARHHADARTALDGCFVEEGGCRGHGIEAGGLSAAAALAKDHHIVGITAKAADVAVHPLQPVANIEESLVAGGSVLFAREVTEVKKSQQAEPVIGFDDNHVPRARQGAAVLIRSAS